MEAAIRFVDLSHDIYDGLVTYPGLAGPTITPEMTFDESRSHYAAGYEFQLDRIDMIANTGTYIDSPAHRVRGGTDLAGLGLAQVAGLETLVTHSNDVGIRASSIDDLDVRGRAVLFHTGWSRHWGTPQYGEGHPHLLEETATALVERGVALVGIDSLNVDGTGTGARPIHTILLENDVPILEHLTNVKLLPDAGALLYAVPPKVRGMGSFPVRAFAVVDPPAGEDSP